MMSQLLWSIIRMITKIMRYQLFLKATLMLEATRVVMRLSLRQNAEENLHLFKLGKIHSWIYTKLCIVDLVFFVILPVSLDSD